MRALLIIWSILDISLLAAGIISLSFSFIWDQPDLLMNVLVSKFDLRIGMVLGLFLIGSFVISIPAILYKGSNSLALKMFNWTLLANGVVVVIIGSCIWFFSLRQRQEFGELWIKMDVVKQLAIQDMFSCCGYWNGTAAGQLVTPDGFCSDPIFAANQKGCIEPLTAKSDYTLNNVFTTIYGFDAIVAALFIATVCVINERKLDERFMRIDAKRGGGGFV